MVLPCQDLQYEYFAEIFGIQFVYISERIMLMKNDCGEWPKYLPWLLLGLYVPLLIQYYVTLQASYEMVYYDQRIHSHFGLHFYKVVLFLSFCGVILIVLFDHTSSDRYWHFFGVMLLLTTLLFVNYQQLCFMRIRSNSDMELDDAELYSLLYFLTIVLSLNFIIFVYVNPKIAIPIEIILFLLVFFMSISDLVHLNWIVWNRKQQTV